MITFLFFSFLQPASAANQTYQAALAALYPNCLSKKETLYLTKKQSLTTQELSGIKPRTQLRTRYYNKCQKSYIYIDSHIVRTLNETAMIEIKNNKIQKVSIINFMEPKEYLPPKKWLRLFNQKELNSKLKLYQDIDGLSGATLSAHAITNMSREILALNKVLAIE